MVCSSCRERWRRVHFYEPRLESLVNHDVVSIELKAVLVLYHHLPVEGGIGVAGGVAGGGGGGVGLSGGG